jgi:hypothetical protein
MGVAQYRLSPALPEQLKRELPTAEDLATEFPALSAVKLRMEIERALRDVTIGLGITSKRPMSIASVLRELEQRGVAPPSTARFFAALKVMNEAVHGFDVDPVATAQAVSIGTEFLAELANLRDNKRGE